MLLEPQALLSGVKNMFRTEVLPVVTAARAEASF